MAFNLSISWGKKEQRSSIENPLTPVNSPHLLQAFGFPESNSGVSVNQDSALTFSAVYACVSILSDMLSSLPLNVYIKKADGKFIDEKHILTRLLHDQPCDMYTSFDWRQLMETSAALWGNGYSKIIRGNRYQVEWLDFIHPSIVTPYQIVLPNGTKRTRYDIRRSDGFIETIDQDDMIHIKWLSTDGVRGLSPIEIAKEQIGLGLANEKFGAQFFKNGASFSGTLNVAQKLDKQQMERLSEQWHARESHRTPILEQGMEFKPIGIPPEQAQWIASRKFQIEEISRLFRVPLHLISSLDKSSFSNIENQGIDFVVNTMRPRCIRWEQELNRKLLTEAEKADHYTKFNMSALLRGDSTSRAAYLNTMTGMGIYTRNEAREYEDLNPLPGLDDPLTPANLINQQAKDLTL